MSHFYYLPVLHLVILKFANEKARSLFFEGVYNTQDKSYNSYNSLNNLLVLDFPGCWEPCYRHTDKHLGLVITLLVVIALCCTWQSRAPNIHYCAPEI